MYLGNAFSVDVMDRAWERKFIYCSVDALFAVRLETKASHYFKQEFDVINFGERNKKQPLVRSNKRYLMI